MFALPGPLCHAEEIRFPTGFEKLPYSGGFSISALISAALQTVTLGDNFTDFG
jgi:hypothetical protein